MPDESTTPDLVAKTRAFFETMDRDWDFDSLAGFFASDLVWDASIQGLGVFESAATFQSFARDWLSSYDEIVIELEEILDFGNGVVFARVRQSGRPAGTTGLVQQNDAWIMLFEEGLVVRVIAHIDIDEARTAAERLAKERG